MKQFLHSAPKAFLLSCLMVAAFLTGPSLKAQTTLAVGDIAFTGYNSNASPAAGDTIAFVLLANISAGTQISVTDRGYTGSGWVGAGSTEGTVTWTAGSALPMGTEVYFCGLSARVYNPVSGTFSTNGTMALTEGTSPNGLSISNVGDQFIAFQGGGGSITGSGVTIIAGLHFLTCNANTSMATWDAGGCTIGPNASQMPPGLTGGTNAFYTGTMPGGILPTIARFNCTGTPATTAAQVRTAVMNPANWTLSNSALSMPSKCVFISSTPVVNAHPANRTICNNGNTTMSISAAGATSYQWYVNTGAGFSPIGPGAPYSGINSSTLTITGGTTGMNGYQYRCVASNGSGSATSNPATLTVITITTTGTSNNVSCFGGNNGTATVVPSGGIAPYTYSWSPGGGTGATAIGLVANNYSVLVTDNIGCQTTRAFNITEPASALGGIIGKTDVSCNGGSNGTATVVASGGTAPYTYSWSPSGGTNPTATGLSAGTYTVTITDNNGCQITRSTTVNQPIAALTGTISKTDVSCHGGGNGTATVVASGGTAPYTYSWSPSGGTNATATGLSAGTYTVTVTDNNSCQITRSIAVNQPAAALAGSVSKTDVSCHGGSNGTATVVASGGTAPYTYSWSPSGGTNATATGLSAGTYTVTVTDNNSCQITRSITVDQPAAALAGSVSKTDATCNGGSNGTATVLVSGGTTPYTYSWSPFGGTNATATGLSAGTYTVTVTDNNNCQITRSITVDQPVAMSLIPSHTDVSCNGGSNGTATVTVSGGVSPYTYNWSPSGGTSATASGLTAGTYMVTVTDNNTCQATQSYTIAEPPALVLTPSHTDVSCNGGSNGTATVTVSGGVLPYTYSWSPSGGTNATATGLAAGTYTVTVTDLNGCQATRAITVDQPAALNAASSHTDVSCHGGSNGTATVTAGGGAGPYSYSWAPSGGTAATATGLAAGTYTVTITDNHTCQTSQTIVISEPAAISVLASQTDILCNGASAGTATVAVSGGVTPYTYSWSPSGGTAATATGLTAGTYTVTITDSNMCQTTQSFSLLQPQAFSITAEQTDISCHGDSTGTATVTVSGGVTPYTYSWSPSGGTAATATGLTAGTYTVTITDSNMCQTTQSFTLSESPALAVQVSAADVSCFGGNNGYAALTVSGGVTPYTYSWTGGAATDSIGGLIAGTYAVTITDSLLCSAQLNVTINEPAVLSVQMWKQDISCGGNGSDGMAAVTVSGGMAPYGYNWTPGAPANDTISGLSPGMYQVQITDDNGCSITDSIAVDGPEVFQVTDNISICQGQTYTVGNSTYNTSGTYSDTLSTAAGCDSIVTTQLTVNTADVTLVNNDPTLVAAAGGTEYKWMDCESNQLISGAASQSYTATANGSYAVIITQNGCTDTSACADIIRVSLNEVSGGGSVRFFPNPTRGTVTVQTEGIIVKKTELMDITGKQYPVVQNGNSLDLSVLQNGVYLLRVTDANGRQYTSRIVKI